MPLQPASGSSSEIASSGPAAGETGTRSRDLPPHLYKTWLDDLIDLLHSAAGIEHELMVQYLYAAYSLGGDQVPKTDVAEALVREWRRNLLAIAKEEMGHFLTVQNILTVLGGSVLWTRGNHPWDDQYFPLREHEFTRFDPGSLYCYIYAEAPPYTASVVKEHYQIDRKEVQDIIDEATRQVADKVPHRVQQLYAEIVRIVKNPNLIPDSAFHPETYSVQASWEEWGKGYKPYILFSENSEAKDTPPMLELRSPASAWIAPTARQAAVIVQQVATRTEVLEALQLIGEQGEAATFNPDPNQPSHFERFIGIYQRFKDIVGKWDPARQVANSPTTDSPKTGAQRPNTTYIESAHSRNWAHLFNLRYRMLLTYLSHMYRLPPATDVTQPQMRAGTLHRVFSEMYNLRAIANILVRLPMTDEPGDSTRAGPPFELPYTLELPVAEDDCWRLHRDLLLNSEEICKHLLVPKASADETQYLAALRSLDRQSIAWIDAVLRGGAARRSLS